MWRYLYVQKLMQLVKIDMHGSCFHNVAGVPDRNQPNFEASFIEKVKPYRAVLVFENRQEESYISEKIFSAFSAKGVIPIYLGAPDVHMWLPGNHTYVDAAQYETPNALADYIKLILTNDTVYQYHTTNYDTQKVLTFLDQHCPPEGDYICHLCHHMLTNSRKTLSTMVHGTATAVDHNYFTPYHNVFHHSFDTYIPIANYCNFASHTLRIACITT